MQTVARPYLAPIAVPDDVVRGFSAGRDQWSRDAMRRFLPEICRDVFGSDHIIYADAAKIDQLDKQYGVDAIVHAPRRHVALAVRLRSQRYWLSPGDITIRYDSLQTSGKALEMRKSIAHYLVFGWCNTDFPQPPTGLLDWHVVALQRLMDAYLLGRLQPESGNPRRNRDQSSQLMGFAVADLRRLRLMLKSAGQ